MYAIINLEGKHIKYKNLIEQHFHGAFGVNFNTCTVNDVLFVAKKMKEFGFYGFFPTLVTDNIENINCQIKIIKEASSKTSDDSAKILGIHLEGIFINSDKKGIHNDKLFLKPTIENYKLLEDDFIKIVTLAPELCEKDGLIEYLNKKGVKVQAGHCVGENLAGCSAVTHLFNAMSGINHRNPSTALSALINDDIYVEVIADGVHLSDDILKLVFKSKPLDKIILVSDCLPCTESDLKEFNFAGSKIYYDGIKATSKDGTLAGSTTLLPKITERLINKKIITEKQAEQLIQNVYNYHNLPLENI